MSAEPMTRSRRRSRWYAPLALATAAALFLAACESEDEEPAEETTTPVATAEGTTATPAESMTATPEASGTTEMMDDHTVGVATEGDLAPYLVDAEGMTLYITSDDEVGVSNCVDACLDNWPPLLVETGEDATGDLGTLVREDGEGTQVTYNGMPLYYWAADAAAGDTTGHEIGGVWSVVTP